MNSGGGMKRAVAEWLYEFDFRSIPGSRPTRTFDELPRSGKEWYEEMASQVSALVVPKSLAQKEGGDNVS